jgi:hypothetical protein
MFYDYTKLYGNDSIAPNHHITYSSSGISQVVNGELIVNKFSTWDKDVKKLLSGKNVAMAFTSRNDIPNFVIDEKTGNKFEVWNGDNYDARFLDPKRDDGVGYIIGLTNKDRTTKPEEAAKKHGGFFFDYDAKRDGDTLVVQDQSKLNQGKEQPIKFLSKPKAETDGRKFSLALPKEAVDDFFSATEKIPESEGVEIIRSNWIGGVAGIGDRDSAYDLGRVYGGPEYIQSVQDVVRENLGDSFKGYRLMSKEEFEELEAGAVGNQLASFTLDPMVGLRFSRVIWL